MKYVILLVLLFAESGTILAQRHADTPKYVMHALDSIKTAAPKSPLEQK